MTGHWPPCALLRRNSVSGCLSGRLRLRSKEGERFANRSFLIAPDGTIRARYDKIHMFDVEVGDGQSYRESRAYRPGESAVLAETDFGMVGMTICYDIRFPHLYRKLAQAGAAILTAPAAFTRVTGEAHWHILMRARAIETGCFVVAPAQGGKHEDGRETFGHSQIISPWGEILAEADHAEPGIIWADIDLEEVETARRRIPSLHNDQDFGLSRSGKA
jgi:deaminated glutathione amidase